MHFSHETFTNEGKVEVTASILVAVNRNAFLYTSGIATLATKFFSRFHEASEAF